MNVSHVCMLSQDIVLCCNTAELKRPVYRCLRNGMRTNTKSEAVVTVIKMTEQLPEATQDQVVEHLREQLLLLEDELEWDRAFEETQIQLVAAAQRAREEIAAGRAQPMDHDRL